MPDAFIIDACRTPRGIGKQGKGALAHLHPQHLGAHGARRRSSSATASTPPTSTTSSGAPAAQVGEQSGDLGRMAALDAGYDVARQRRHPRPLLRVGHHRQQLRRRDGDGRQEDLVIGGGTEMMSLPKKGLMPMGAGNAHLQELHPQSHQGVCADAIATLEGIDRARPSTSTRPSRSGAPRVAIKEGRFDRSLVPVLNLDGTVALDHEEFPRPRHDGRVAGRAAAELPGRRRLPARRGRPHVPRADQPAVPRPRRSSTSTTPATRSGVVDGAGRRALRQRPTTSRRTA